MIAGRLALAQTLFRLGLRRLGLVFLHRRRLKSGFYERALPIHDWRPASSALVSPFVVPSNLASQSDGCLEAAERIAGGELRYFSWKWLPWPTTWRENPFTGFRTEATHWSRLKDFDERQGDIKWIWEPSRFDWAVTLARAFATGGDTKYEDAFWTLFNSWRENNPPNTGVNWYCGQECSLRLLATVFASTVFHDRDGKLASLVEELAERVEPTMGYAIAQHNNHGTSEAMGLYLAGSALPDHPKAAHWRRQGRAILSSLVLEQFAPDGSYVQHSFVYQRLAMRACLVAFHTARRLGDPFPSEIEQRVLTSARFLRSLMPTPGALPNYGANDGANALAISDGDYLDFRPVVQLAYALLAGERAFAPGPWDEELAWYGIDAESLVPAPSLPTSVRAEDGGYFALRGEAESYAFMRVPNYRDGRPGQADALHVDVWFGGQPVAVDSGTYSYNDPEGWYKHFKATRAHNTVEVDGKDQMPLASRFLYTQWTRCEAPKTASKANTVVGISHAYEQIGLGVHHERRLRLNGGRVEVTDLLTASSAHQIVARWHLVGQWREGPQNSFVRDDGITLTVAGDGIQSQLITDKRPECTLSLLYGDLQPLTLLEIALEGKNGTVTTVFAPPESPKR